MKDTSIRTYRAKRDFAVTAEPAPDESPRTTEGRSFVVQKHAARRAGLHWDFRLEHGGVLWSWAVPRGPSLDPADRRMAVHVEDHPLDYAGFQGVIPDGEYGAGTVETWDRGTWSPIDDPAFGMAKGHLHFTLDGTRLHGRFSLVRGRKRGTADAWFLVKHQDEFARAGATAPEIERQVPLTPRKSGAPAKGARKAALPAAQEPQLCTLAKAPPADGGWLTEVKFDGYRILARIDGGQVRLLTRNGLDWAERMPHLAAALATLGVKRAMIDGELVALRPDGVSSFPALQKALKAGRDDTLTFYASTCCTSTATTSAPARCWTARPHWPHSGLSRPCSASATTSRPRPPRCSAPPAPSSWRASSARSRPLPTAPAEAVTGSR